MDNISFKNPVNQETIQTSEKFGASILKSIKTRHNC